MVKTVPLKELLLQKYTVKLNCTWQRLKKIIDCVVIYRIDRHYPIGFGLCLTNSRNKRVYGAAKGREYAIKTKKRA